jgi:hypothetical protein
MSVAEFPMFSTSGSNPKPNVFYQMPEAFQVGSTQYDDGGIDTALQHGGNGIKRWFLFYEGMTAVQAALLDSHMYSAKLDENGLSAFTFSFRDRDTTTLYTGVRYQKYERPAHKHKDIQTRTVILVKFP